MTKHLDLIMLAEAVERGCVITHGDRPETFSIHGSAAEAEEALAVLQVSLPDARIMNTRDQFTQPKARSPRFGRSVQRRRPRTISLPRIRIAEDAAVLPAGMVIQCSAVIAIGWLLILAWAS